ncbi:MAG TPA: MATE family efflux transporter [Candidatus Mediterraneibacter cottocaccae]|nr:MATE family efflux transporter [Candidatus Mediterraneibacter cottocaccae]
MENNTAPEKKNTFMQTKPVFSLLLSMSFPMMLSMLIQSLYNIVDSIYVSWLGTGALTAVSLAYPLQNAIVSVAVGIGVGISSAISIHLGSGNQEKADRAATLGMALTVLHCVLFILAGIFITGPFLSLFTDNPDVYRDACDYTYIVLCFSFGSLLQISFEKIFQGIGEMKITMYFLAAGCIINIILDPIMIFGLLGFPALGVTGAAIATVLGQIGSFLLYVIAYLRKPYAVKIHPKYLVFDRKIIAQIYRVGIPSSIMMLLPSVLVSILNRILVAFSEVYVAVLGVYFKLQTFIYMPANGIVQGMRPIIGYNYGAGEARRVKTTIRYSLACAAVLMLAGTLLALLIPGQILSLFDADAELMEAGTTALRIISLGFLVSSIGVIYSGTFEALGSGRNSLIISLLRQFVITIPLSLILARLIGPAGVWISFPAGELCAAVAAYFLLRRYQKGAFAPF